MRRLLLLIVFALVSWLMSQAQQMSRFQALYIFNFAKNTSWDAHDMGKPLVISVVGDKAVAQDLRTIVKGKSVGDRTVTIQESATAQGVGDVDLIFLGGAKANQIETLVASQATNKVLIVSATEGHCSHGAAIAFELVNGKFTYSICESNITSHGLAVTKLLVNNGRAI